MSQPRPFRLTAPRLTENHVEAQCLDILALHRYWVRRLHAGVFLSLDGRRHIHGVAKGTPDYVCLHGRHRPFLLEVKRPGGVLSDEQKIQIAVAREQFDLTVAVVEKVEDFSEWLERHERSP